MKTMKRTLVAFMTTLVTAGAIYTFGVGHPAVIAVQHALELIA